MRSKDLNKVEQLHLPITGRAVKPLVDQTVIAAQPSFLAAINLMFNLSGLEDKEIYLALKIDAGHWSRLRKGDGHFPTNKLEDAMSLCDSDIPLQYLAIKKRCEVRPMLSELERRLECERARADRAEEKLRTIIEYHQQVGGRR